MISESFTITIYVCVFMCLQFMYYHYYYITSESANAEHHSFLLLFSFLRHLSFRNLIQDSRVVEVRVVGMIG